MQSSWFVLGTCHRSNDPLCIHNVKARSYSKWFKKTICLPHHPLVLRPYQLHRAAVYLAYHRRYVATLCQSQAYLMGQCSLVMEGDGVKFKTNRIVRSISRDITHKAYAIHINTSIHANSWNLLDIHRYFWPDVCSGWMRRQVEAVNGKFYH